MNSNRYSKVPEHMRAEVKRVIEKHSGRRVPLRRQTLSALKTYGHFLARDGSGPARQRVRGDGPLDLDFENQFKWMINQQQYSEDFKQKLRTVIPKQKAIEKKVTQLVLKTYQNFERKYLSNANTNFNSVMAQLVRPPINDKIWKNEYYNLDKLTHQNSHLLERYRDQLLAKEIIKALGIRVSELRPYWRIGALSLATTKAYITHKNPLNRPYNQRLITNNNERMRPEHSISVLIRDFLWPIYYRKNKSTIKVPYERKIVPANVNRDVVTLNNFKNGDKVIRFGNPHRYLSQNSFINLAKMTPTEAFFLSKNWNNRVPLFRDPFNRTRTVYRHDLGFVTLNMNPRYNKAAVKIQSRYKGGKYRNTQIKIANAAEKKSVAANRAAQIAREKFNQAKKVRDVITKRRKKSPSKNNNSPSKRRTLRANAATARATASKRRSP
jgi:hypothetical protein